MRKGFECIYISERGNFYTKLMGLMEHSDLAYLFLLPLIQWQLFS